MSEIKVNAITDASGGNTTTVNGVTPNSNTVKGRNLLINGDMRIAQRGTSFTDSDTYSVDRWRLNQSAETMTVTQESFAAGQTDVPRAEKYLRVNVTTTGQNAGMAQRIEGVEQLSGQTVTLSFYARGGQGTTGVIPTTFRTNIRQYFGSGGSTDVVQQVATSHALTSSWQKFTISGTLGSTSGKTIGTGAFTEVFFQQIDAEACDFDLALCQLEVGSVATDFDHRSYGEELQLCKRYYQIEQRGQLIYGTYQSGSGAYTRVTAFGQFQTEMRDTPTVSLTGDQGYLLPMHSSVSPTGDKSDALPDETGSVLSLVAGTNGIARSQFTMQVSLDRGAMYTNACFGGGSLEFDAEL